MRFGGAALLCLRMAAAFGQERPSRASDYSEHLEIDFDDDNTPPPWEEDEGRDGGIGGAPVPQGGTGREDKDWVPDAVKDVAYFLRQFKFNEYDRRYHSGNFSGERGFVGAFPTLHSLHWEVRDACEQGFLECLRYLQDKLLNVHLRREDDTANGMREKQLSWPVNATDEKGPSGGVFESMEEKRRSENREQVLSLDKMCQGLREVDETSFDGFVGPLDRFQWRSTASYYMCAFTMKAEPALRHLGEPCDNFAWCLDWTLGPVHGDPRALDTEPFQCARYSFCPDPCCPQRLVRSIKECVSDDNNPCRFATVELGQLDSGERPPCTLEAALNRDLDSMTKNRWNTSCACGRPGYRWEARFGFCVDEDECAERHPCNKRNHEECVNTPGSFLCRCRWGWHQSRSGMGCIVDPQAQAVASARKGGAEVDEEERRRGVWEIFEDILVPGEK